MEEIKGIVYGACSMRIGDESGTTRCPSHVIIASPSNTDRETFAVEGMTSAGNEGESGTIGEIIKA